MVITNTLLVVENSVIFTANIEMLDGSKKQISKEFEILNPGRLTSYINGQSGFVPLKKKALKNVLIEVRIPKLINILDFDVSKFRIQFHEKDLIVFGNKFTDKVYQQIEENIKTGDTIIFMDITTKNNSGWSFKTKPTTNITVVIK